MLSAPLSEVCQHHRTQDHGWHCSLILVPVLHHRARRCRRSWYLLSKALEKATAAERQAQCSGLGALVPHGRSRSSTVVLARFGCFHPCSSLGSAKPQERQQQRAPRCALLFSRAPLTYCSDGGHREGEQSPFIPPPHNTNLSSQAETAGITPLMAPTPPSSATGLLCLCRSNVPSRWDGLQGCPVAAHRRDAPQPALLPNAVQQDALGSDSQPRSGLIMFPQATSANRGRSREGAGLPHGRAP